MTTLHLTLAEPAAQTLTGLEAELAAAARAGLSAAGANLTARLKDHTASVLGRRLAWAWRYSVSDTVAGPQVWIWPGDNRAGEILEAHAQGAVINAQTGRWLAIPTKAAPRTGRGRRLSPREAEEAGIRLRFRPVQGGKAGGLLIAVNRRPPVVLYVLVRQVTLRKRLDIDGVINRAAFDLPGIIIEHLAEE
jgi:hypothetical protein